MKQTSEMNLAECFEELMLCSHCPITVEEVCYRIKELTRWISVSERMPTEKDFGIGKRFRVWIGSIDSTAIFTEGKLYVWDDEAYNSGWTEYDPNNHRVAFTHWQHITTPEGKP